MQRKSLCRLLAFFTVVMLFACQPAQEWHGTEVTGVLPDLDFQLVGEDGAPAKAGDFRGKVTILYFGFTHCPGVCPATLGQIAVAMDELGEEAAGVQALLVTVDPARDTPDALEAYTARFGPWLHGLTGPEDELKALNLAYKVNYQLLPPDASGAYDVQHSNAVFAFDSQGRARLLIRDTADTRGLVSDLRRLVKLD